MNEDSFHQPQPTTAEAEPAEHLADVIDINRKAAPADFIRPAGVAYHEATTKEVTEKLPEPKISRVQLAGKWLAKAFANGRYHGRAE
jgi:hypothetical protein